MQVRYVDKSAGWPMVPLDAAREQETRQQLGGDPGMVAFPEEAEKQWRRTYERLRKKVFQSPRWDGAWFTAWRQVVVSHRQHLRHYPPCDAVP